MKNLYLGLMAFFVKAGPKIFTVFSKILKTVKVAKVGLAGASLVTYSYMFTWQFAAMICVMLFVHESGHIWAMKRCGLKTKGIYFIPFFGAAAVSSEAFPSRASETYIALMGPLWGFGISLGTALLYYFSENALFAAGAGWMATCNLFNLLPIMPLDGGRVLNSVAFSIHSALGKFLLIQGMILLFLIGDAIGFGLFMFLLVIGGIELLMGWGWRHRRKKELAKTVLYVKNILQATDEGINEVVKYLEAHEPDIEYVRKLEESGKIRTCSSSCGISYVYGEFVLTQLYIARGKILQYCGHEKPTMNNPQIAYSVLSYIGIGAILWLLVKWTEHVPEVSAAMEILKG